MGSFLGKSYDENSEEKKKRRGYIRLFFFALVQTLYSIFAILGIFYKYFRYDNASLLLQYGYIPKLEPSISQILGWIVGIILIIAVLVALGK